MPDAFKLMFYRHINEHKDMKFLEHNFFESCSILCSERRTENLKNIFVKLQAHENEIRSPS